MHRHGGLDPVRSASTGIFRIIAVLATVMMGILAIWALIERALIHLSPGADLTGLSFVRAVSTAVIMSALAAWLMLRYRQRYESLLRAQSSEAHRMRLFFENIVQDAGEGIVTFDRNGVILSWNRAAGEIFGYSASEMSGGNIDRLLPPDLMEAGEAKRLTDLVAEKGYFRNFATRRVRKDGSVINVEITRSALRDAQGGLTGSTAIVRDVTASNQMEARLIQAEKLAAIGQAAASIAHEVRNALAGISGTVEVLKSSSAWKELPEEFGTEFDLQVARIAHIVQDLLSYARPGTLAVASTNIHRLIDRTLSEIAANPEASGKTVRRQFAPEAVLARVDAGRLQQAFTNVVTNALQAMEPGGTLLISTGRANGQLRITFRDTGPGMSGETLSHAFEPFFTTKVRGTGLGLSIVRSIIEAHHGSVDLVSDTGSGTDVVLTLPAEPTQEKTEDESMLVKKPSAKVALAIMIAFLGLAGGLLMAADATFVGAAKCKMCHASQHTTWMESSHAKAFEVLPPEDQKKAECLSCHTTGAGKAAAEGAELNGVQCESCHGAGSEYKSMKIMSKKAYAENREAAHKASMDAGLVMPDEKTCTSCHNEKSPTFKGFDFVSAKEKIKHWD